MIIGYLRVSTKDQRPDRQIDGLEPLCDELHIERMSAVADDRPVLDQVLRKLNAGDTLLVWDLDRAFRSTEDAIAHARSLRERGIAFQAVNFVIDTVTADGNYAFQINAAAAERERRKISERTLEGLRAARARGVKLGRRPKMTDDQIRAAISKLDANADPTQVAAEYGVHPWTLVRSIRRLERAQ